MPKLKHTTEAKRRLSATADIPQDLLKTYLGQKVVAVDTELQGLQLWRDQICLVQISDRAGNVCLVRVTAPKVPANLKKLMTAPSTVKIFHYALSDVAFFKASLNLDVHPFRCTKVMSKLARTYTESHSLKTLVSELAGVDMNKESQMTDWSRTDLSENQLEYAANDVLFLVQVYDALEKMIVKRGKLPSGTTLRELNEKSQQCLPAIIEVILNGYGDRDRGWETSLFSH